MTTPVNRLTYPRREYTDQDVLTVEETAEYLRLSAATVYKHIALDASCSGRIPSIAVGRRRLVVFWQLKVWLAAQAGMTMPSTLPVRQH